MSQNYGHKRRISALLFLYCKVSEPKSIGNGLSNRLQKQLRLCVYRNNDFCKLLLAISLILLG